MDSVQAIRRALEVAGCIPPCSSLESLCTRCMGLAELDKVQQLYSIAAEIKRVRSADMGEQERHNALDELLLRLDEAIR